MDNPVIKLKWTNDIYKIVNDYWQNEIFSSVPYYKNLYYINCLGYYPGKVHPLLQLDTQSVKDNSRIPAKLKFLCGSYVRQSNRRKFNKNCVDPTCPPCKSHEDTLEHFIVVCPTVTTIRDPIIKQIQDELELSQNVNFRDLSNKHKIQLILDCTILLNRENRKYRTLDIQKLSTVEYRNDSKFSDKYAWANSADPDQTAPRE